LAWDFENTNFPLPVLLNRFAAARLVLIFGIFLTFLSTKKRVAQPGV
jgi:hypothetical protein